MDQVEQQRMMNQAALARVWTSIWWVWPSKVGVVTQIFRALTLEHPSTKSWLRACAATVLHGSFRVRSTQNIDACVAMVRALHS